MKHKHLETNRKNTGVQLNSPLILFTLFTMCALMLFSLSCWEIEARMDEPWSWSQKEKEAEENVGRSMDETNISIGISTSDESARPERPKMYFIERGKYA